MINEDHYVHVKRSKHLFIILSLYVDDFLLALNSKEFVLTIKKWLSSNFDMKDMSEAEYILGVKIQHDHSKKFLVLLQEPYITKILERFNMYNCKSNDTPITKGKSLSLKMCPKTLEEKQNISRILYSCTVGSLMYIMICTRPDITYAMGLISSYHSNSGLTY